MDPNPQLTTKYEYSSSTSASNQNIDHFHQGTVLTSQVPIHHNDSRNSYIRFTMAGSSLWLVPPPSHPLHEILTTLITTTLPALVPPGPAPPSDKTASPPSPSPPTFAPHLTLTSNIDPSSTYATSPSPQAWLDALPFPAGTAVRVIFERVKTDNFFFRRCYLKVGYDGVRYVAAVARARGVEGEEEVGRRTEKWLEEWRAAFGPHVSLL